MRLNESGYFSKPPFITYFRKVVYSVLIALILALAFEISHLWEQTTPTFGDEDKKAILYSNQIHDDLRDVFTSAIKSAQKSVLLIVYTLTDPAIIKALKEKSQEGVEVRVISDAKESSFVNSELGSLVSMTRRFSEGRMHQKILVVDDNSCWIGSANMTSESLHMHGNLVTFINNNALSTHIRAKASTLPVQGHDSLFPHKEFSIEGQLIELWFLPDDQKAIGRLKDLMRSAKKCMRIGMFTWTRMDLANEAISAANRGVKVEVVLDSRQGKGASARIVKLLKNSNVKISLSRGGPLLHHKFLYTDNETLVNGSANWTKDAFSKNDEIFLVIHDLTPTQQQQMESLWKVISQESLPAN